MQSLKVFSEYTLSTFSDSSFKEPQFSWDHTSLLSESEAGEVPEFKDTETLTEVNDSLYITNTEMD